MGPRARNMCSVRVAVPHFRVVRAVLPACFQQDFGVYRLSGKNNNYLF